MNDILVILNHTTLLLRPTVACKSNVSSRQYDPTTDQGQATAILNIIFGGNINARAPFQRGKERGCHAVQQPCRHSVEPPGHHRASGGSGWFDGGINWAVGAIAKVDVARWSSCIFCHLFDGNWR